MKMRMMHAIDDAVGVALLLLNLVVAAQFVTVDGDGGHGGHVYNGAYTGKTITGQ